MMMMATMMMKRAALQKVLLFKPETQNINGLCKPQTISEKKNPIFLPVFQNSNSSDNVSIKCNYKM